MLPTGLGSLNREYKQEHTVPPNFFNCILLKSKLNFRFMLWGDNVTRNYDFFPRKDAGK
jgi:hypothetical protein